MSVPNHGQASACTEVTHGTPSACYALPIHTHRFLR